MNPYVYDPRCAPPHHMVSGGVYAPFRPYVGQYTGPDRPPGSSSTLAPEGERPIAHVVGLTLIGLVLFGGAGALAGWLIGRTQQAALVGALVGISAPPAASALLYMQQGQGGPSR